MGPERVELGAVMRRLEWAYLGVVLFLATGAAQPYYNMRGLDGEELVSGDPVVQLIWALLYGIAGFLVLRRRREILPLLRENGLLLALTAFACLSILWSAFPEMTARRGLALLGTTLVGFYLGVRLQPRELLRLLAWVLGIATVLSPVVVLLLPQFGIQSDPWAPPAWRGIFGHKNIFGRAMLLACAVWLSLALDSGGLRKGIALAFLGASVIFLLLSRSVTSAVVLVTVLAALPVVLLVKRDRLLVLSLASFLLGMTILTLAVIVGYQGYSLVERALTDYLGRNLTLTGRSVIWALVWQAVQRAPWLGYGYSAFWLGDLGPSQIVARSLGANVAHAHNGFLGLWLELGLVGLLLFLGVLVHLGIRIIRWIQSGAEGGDFIFPLLFFAAFLLINMTETAALTRNNIFWILFITLSLLSSPSALSRPGREAARIHRSV